MKKSIYIFGTCLVIGLSACSEATTDEAADGAETEVEVEEPKAEPTIVGDWGLTDFDMGMEVPKGQEKMMEDMKKEMIANSTMSYKADGSYTQVDKMGKDMVKKSGTYKVDGAKLTYKTSAGDEETLNFELNDDVLVISVEDRGSVMKMTYGRK